MCDLVEVGWGFGAKMERPMRALEDRALLLLRDTAGFARILAAA
jgi:hypothetical protein